jgi:tyrosine-protein phosphatase non-receptor type 23
MVPPSNQQYYGNTQQQFQGSYSYPSVSGGYGSQQTAQMQPNVCASALSSEFQYMAVGGVSCYTNAGNYITSQTCSSQTSVDGHTFASQYDTSQGVSSYQTPVNSQVSYYSLPYGYQYDTDGTVGTSPQGLNHVQQNHYGGSTVVNQVPQSPMTYMQARGPNDSTTTTFSQQGGNSVSSSSVQALTCNGSENVSSSNVDLLAGLDFSLNQAPLVPQQSETTMWQKDELVTKSVSSSVQQKTSAGSDVHIPDTVAVTEIADLSSGSSASQPDAATSKLPWANGSQAEKDGTQQLLVSNLELSKGTGGQEEGKLTPKTFGKDPYTDPEALNQFVQEVGKYEKFVDGLTTKTLNGPTPLDMKWKELLELQVNLLYIAYKEGMN